MFAAFFAIDAAPVTPQQAQAVAVNFMTKKVPSVTRNSGCELVYACTDTRSSDALYYVFNFSGGGFVIVAGDDAVTPVLGYSKSGTFDYEHQPDNRRAWLQDYAGAIRQARYNENHTADEAVGAKWQQLAADGYQPATRNGASIVVEPLVTTAWNQWPYYNSLCPNYNTDEPTPTGCVATALAQIIKYHEWPAQGRGTHGYYHDVYGYQYADFGSTTYQYDLMPTELDENSSADEVNAVATLMYHCGVALNMDYDTWGSGAYDINVRVAAANYFDYDTKMAFKNAREPGWIIGTWDNTVVYDDDTWIAMLKSELDQHRPIYYGGHPQTDPSLELGGHAFVCDGYDADNFFHINWGWGNIGDEYYSIAIGGGLGYDNYNQVVFMKPKSNKYLLDTGFNNENPVRSTTKVDGQLDISSATGFNGGLDLHYDHAMRDTLTLYPQSAGAQIMLQKVNFDSPSNWWAAVEVYDGENTDGAYLETINNSASQEPVVSTTGALTLVSNGYYPRTNDMLLRATEVKCRPVAANFTCANSNYGSAVFGWEVHYADDYLDHNFNWQVEYGLRGFQPGTGMRVNATGNSAMVGGLVAETEYDAYLHYTCSGGQMITLGPVAFTTAELKDCFDKPIVEGNSNAFALGFNDYVWQQQIYTAQELSDYGLEAGDEITSMSVQFAQTVQNLGVGKIRNIALYMGHTTEDEFLSTTDWYPLESLTNVFPDSSIVFNRIVDGEWLTFNFSSSFVWDGTSNIVIAFTDSSSSWSPYIHFRSNNTTLKSRLYHGTYNNPITTSHSGYYEYNRANIRFCIGGYCMKTANIAKEDLSEHSMKITWYPGYLETAWNVEYGPQGFEPGTGIAATVSGAPEFTLSQLSSGYYDFYVQADCGDATGKWVKATFATSDIECTQYGELSNNSYKYPFYHSDENYYSYTQQIFKAADLVQAGLVAGDNIVSLALNYTGTVKNTQPVTVYLGNSERESFVSYDQWISPNKMQKVFEGRLHLENGWSTIYFDEPFTWDGKPIVMAFLNNSGHDYCADYNCNEMRFSYFHSPSSMLCKASNTPIDIYNLTTPQNVIYNVNDVNNVLLCKSTACAKERTVDIVINEGDTYSFYGREIGEQGTYYHRWYVNEDCDSLVRLNLTVRKILYVTTTGSGAKNGGSWANAMDLQSAMDTAGTFRNVSPYLYVKKGTYPGNTASDAVNSFEIKPNFKAYGGFNGNEPADYDLSNLNPATNQTILLGSNTRRVLYQNTDFEAGREAYFCGFIIRNGTVNTAENGGGAYIRKNCTLDNCKITANTAAISGTTNNINRRGVAVYNDGGTLVNCEIYSNTVNLSGTASGHVVTGVGIYNNGVLKDCNIRDNIAVYEGDGNNWSVNGGGLYNTGNGVVEDCIITGNSGSRGGGAYLLSKTNGVAVKNCIISNNTARVHGGGMFVESSDNGKTRIVQCLIGNNAAGSCGGGVYDSYSGGNFIACNIVRNSAVSDGGGFYASSKSILRNSVIWGNKVGATLNQINNSTNFTFESSAVQGGYSGAISLNVENTGSGVGYPVFANPTPEAGVDVNNSFGDWTPLAGSSLINLGSNIFVKNINTDLCGNVRVQQGRADIGAYESGHQTANPIHPEEVSNIIYVTTTGAGSHDGSSWANATSDLQYAMEVAANNEPASTVWVAGGTYTINKPFIVQPKVAVYGSFAGNEPYTYDLSLRNFEANATILDGDSTCRVLEMTKPFENPAVEIIRLTEPGEIIMPANGTVDVTACSGVIYDDGGLNGNHAINCKERLVLRSYNENSTASLSGSYYFHYSGGMKIYNGEDGTVVGNYTGSGEINTPVPGNCVIIEFESNSTATAGGLELNFAFSECSPETDNTAIELPFKTGVSLFDGFTMQKGFNPNQVDYNGLYGGGYLMDNVEFANCSFKDNYNSGVYAKNCKFNNCTFSGNNGYGLRGEGLTVNKCTASGNSDYGMYLTSNSSADSCVFDGNTNGLYISTGKVINSISKNNGSVNSQNYGIRSISSTQIVNTSIINNYGTGLYAEGGLYVNINIANNATTRTSYNSVAGLYASGNARFVNCNIVNNKATTTSTYSTSNIRGGILNSTSNNEYTNCIIWGNKSQEEVGNIYGESTFSYCAVEGGRDGIANINLEASNSGGDNTANYVNFVNPTTEAGNSTQTGVDWNIGQSSACRNMGNPNTTSLNLPLYDLGGSLRIKQNRIDIGAYEYGDVTTQNIDEEICLGESFFYDDYFVYPEEPGIFRDTFIYYQSGADYIAYINLKVNGVYNVNFDASICEGESFPFNGQNYSATGTYPVYLQSAAGCDSTVVLNLTVNTPVSSEFFATACDEYVWNGVSYNVSGDHQQRLTSATGCDSVVTLHLTIHNSAASDKHLTLCRSALPYTFGNTTFWSNTPDYDTVPCVLKTIHGCDSIVTVYLTILDIITTEISETACDSYTWNDITYTQSGNYKQSFTSSIGCDSVVTLHLTVNHSVADLVEATACDEHVWNDITYTQSGSYEQTFTAANGCDSVVTLHLTVNHSTSSSQTVEVCDSYTWIDGITYTETPAVAPTYTLTNAVGCDSVITLNLTVNHSANTDHYLTICEYELPYQYADTLLEIGTAGTSVHTFHYTTVSGCDSTATLYLTVVPMTSPAITVTGVVTACESGSATLSLEGDYETYGWSTGETSAAITVTDPGYYYVEVTDENGCTFTSEMLHLGASELIEQTPAICMVGVENNHNLIVWNPLDDQDVVNYNIYRENSQANVYELLATVPAGGVNYYEDVTADPSIRAYRYKMAAADECGGETPMSALHKTVHLTINQGLGNSWNLIWTPYEGFEFASYRLYRGTANNNLQLIQTMPSTLTSFTDNNPSGDALFYQIEVVMEESCVQQTRDVSFNGVRSNIVYNGVAVHTEQNIDACESYDWNGQVLTQSGEYTQSFESALGYDSVVTLHLTIFHTPEFTISGDTGILLGQSTVLTVPNNPQWTFLWSTGATTSHITVTPTESTVYTVTVTNGPCSATQSVSVFITGIDDLNVAGNVKVFPNPANSILTVKTQFVAPIQMIEVFNTVGTRFITSTPTATENGTTRINVSGLADGMYFVRVTTEAGSVTKPFVVKR